VRKVHQRTSSFQGDEIVIDEERFRCPELLFDPNLNGKIKAAAPFEKALQLMAALTSSRLWNRPC